MTYKPFKMKGSPMQRNFGVRTPMQAKDDKQSEESKMQAALIQRAYSKWNKANPNASKMMKKKDLTVKKVDDMFAGPKKEAVSTDPKEKK
jgi:hypothetical protein